MIDEKYLRERLWKCPYAYDDFVEGTIYMVKKYASEEQYQELIDVLENNPEIEYPEIVRMTRYRKQIILVDGKPQTAD